MAETLVLDTVEEADSRTELDITPYVGEQGPDFGDAQIEQYLAELGYGSSPVDFRVPNRTVTIPLLIRGRTGGLSFDEVRTRVQAKAGLWQREGGWLKRETAVGTVYADVVNATLRLGGSGLQARGLVDADAVLTLECLPDWYGDEISLAEHDVATLPELVFTETGIDGDYPARCRLVVRDLQLQAQRGLLWGFRCRHYSADATARLAYEAESLEPTGVGVGVVSLAGASGGSAVQHTNLGTDWTTVLSTGGTTGGTPLTHVGAYRVFARVRSPQGSSVEVRLIYSVGSAAVRVENEGWQIPAADEFYVADLGAVSLAQVPLGTHVWEGLVQGKGAAGGEDVYIDRLWLLPVDESAGWLRADSGDHVIGSGGRAELRTDGMYRETTSQSYYSAAPQAVGDLPRLPVAGLEGRTVEVFVKPSRGDLEQAADAGIDAVRAQLHYRPCWLYVPEQAGS